jgi:two-component system, cell cycle sensor histidine kinase and response regulator CckA
MLAVNSPEDRQPGVMDRSRARGSETILLVEDDDAVRAVTRRALTRFGYSVLPAAGGDEALELAREHPDEIELLLTDIMMPGRNGVEVAQEIVEVRPHIRVFYMSGYADQDLVRQGLLKPGTRFLQKPFTPQELAERVREILGPPESKKAG